MITTWENAISWARRAAGGAAVDATDAERIAASMRVAAEAASAGDAPASIRSQERAPNDKPWLLYVNYAGPHPPMDITRSMASHYRGPDRTIDGFPQPHDYKGDITPEHHLRIRQNYAAMIENIDRWTGVYLDTLERRGELDNTIIVYSSDHGEMLGDHGLIYKGARFYEGLVHDLLNDYGKEQVMEDITRWIVARVPAA